MTINEIRKSLLIVVPTLNSYLILPKLIDSIKNQHFENWELLFVDGNSSLEHRSWLINFCKLDSRFNYLVQPPHEKGIYGAMNVGFKYVKPYQWLLFWGSDDWAADSYAFNKAMDSIKNFNDSGCFPDLLICDARYFSNDMKSKRISSFRSASSFRRSLFLGKTPPHQGTFFGPKVREKISFFSDKYTLAADLDYFLKVSRYSNLIIKTIQLELVHMGTDGISGKQTFRRLKEVSSLYLQNFGFLWFIPFIFRYIRRFKTLFFSN